MVPKPVPKTKWFARLGDNSGNLVVEFFTHWPDPRCWGVVLADVAHHVAETYSQRDGTFNPRPILRRIIEAMNAEIRNPKTQRTCLSVREPVRPARRAAGGGGGR